MRVRCVIFFYNNQRKSVRKDRRLIFWRHPPVYGERVTIMRLNEKSSFRPDYDIMFMTCARNISICFCTTSANRQCIVWDTNAIPDTDMDSDKRVHFIMYMYIYIVTRLERTKRVSRCTAAIVIYLIVPGENVIFQSISIRSH